MSRYGPRSSAGDLGRFADDDLPRAPERWDRDKFERFSRRRPDESETFRFQERDRFEGGRGRREIEVEDRIDRRGPRGGRFEERDRFYEEEKFGPPARRRMDLFQEEIPPEVSSRALAPYRRKSIVERDFEPPVRRPARPGVLRRQSSLDTFDRRPMQRYGDRDEFRPPVNVPIPLPRRRSPPRRYKEEKFEEVRYREIDAEPREEEYRDIRIRREKSVRRGAKSVKSVQESSSSSDEVSRRGSPERQPGKKGKTRMPKRLVHKSAIIQLGYPFEEEEDFLIVRRALQKEQIDEVIKISESYKREENNKTVYRFEETVTKQLEGPVPQSVHDWMPPPPPPPMSNYPPPQSVRAPSPARSHHPSHHPTYTVRSPSPPRREFYEERVEQSNHISGPLAVVLPDRSRNHREERDIKAEIRALEAEKRALKLEREAEEKRQQADRIRDSEHEVIERRDKEKDVVRIEKDRKGRLALVRSTH
ncbi:hypothetical protein LTR04_001208 [Oleoguttula sp. CCFEE 6159]|nr:hypothetical protein LTR04_001208 [Oleoguttula sp. CCFEE 6159]